MEIDFHHAATYVLARIAGFDHDKADVLAHCAQYVDDATDSGVITFKNGAMYTCISSAHKTLDGRNKLNAENQATWLPFHFLPGNGGLTAGEDPAGTFIKKIICRPFSYVAKDMLRYCIQEQKAPYGLHRLGITMHIFADTWAHQGFAGVRHESNNVRSMKMYEPDKAGFFSRVVNSLMQMLERLIGKLAGNILPVGHGSVATYPDIPWLVWQYNDHEGIVVERDNPTAFLGAANEMCKAMQKYLASDPDAVVPGLDPENRQKIDAMIRKTTHWDPVDRHADWLSAIADGEFGFTGVKLKYNPDIWRMEALGQPHSKHEKEYEYRPSFLTSNWKMFHDGLQAHHFTIVNHILPNYGICTA